MTAWATVETAAQRAPAPRLREAGWLQRPISKGRLAAASACGSRAASSGRLTDERAPTAARGGALVMSRATITQMRHAAVCCSSAEPLPRRAVAFARGRGWASSSPSRSNRRNRATEIHVARRAACVGLCSRRCPQVTSRGSRSPGFSPGLPSPRGALPPRVTVARGQAEARSRRRSLQAIAKAEAVTGNAARLVGAPTLCLCQAPGEEGPGGADLLLVPSEREPHACRDACRSEPVAPAGLRRRRQWASSGPRSSSLVLRTRDRSDVLVRRSAPEGSHFADGDRAAGVFGVLATALRCCRGSWSSSPSRATTRRAAAPGRRHASLRTSSRRCTPAIASATAASGELVCYARNVVHQEWPKMKSGTLGDGPSVPDFIFGHSWCTTFRA